MWKHFQRRKAVPVEVGAASHAVVAEVFLGLFWAIVLPRVWPQQVAHRPECRRFLKSVQLARETRPWLHLSPDTQSTYAAFYWRFLLFSPGTSTAKALWLHPALSRSQSAARRHAISECTLLTLPSPPETSTPEFIIWADTESTLCRCFCTRAPAQKQKHELPSKGSNWCCIWVNRGKHRKTVSCSH